MGTEISEDDILNVQQLCDQVVEITQYRTQLYEYLQARMMAIAPNLTVLLGELVGARLISHAGTYAQYHLFSFLNFKLDIILTVCTLSLSTWMQLIYHYRTILITLYCFRYNKIMLICSKLKFFILTFWFYIFLLVCSSQALKLFYKC